MGNICNVARTQDAASDKQAAAFLLNLMIKGRWKMDWVSILQLAGNESKSTGRVVPVSNYKTGLSHIQPKSS